MASSVLLLVLALVAQPYLVRCAYQDRVFLKTEGDLDVLTQKWRQLDQNSLGFMESVVKQVLPILVRMSSELDISDECTGSILKMLAALKDGKLWAFYMVDATGKPPGGQLLGTLSFFGSHAQCLNVNATDSWNPNKVHFRGKYCLARFHPPMPTKPKLFTITDELEVFKNITLKSEVMSELKILSSIFYSYPFQWGICVPSTCTNDDMSEIIGTTFDKMGLIGELHSCETAEDEVVIENGQIAVFCFIGVFVFFAVTATVLETFGKTFRKALIYNKTQMCWKLVRAFSIRLNTKKTFQMKNLPEDQTFSSLNGVRFISICWIVVVHVYSLFTPHLYREALNVNAMGRDFSFQIITSAALGVDTFFFVTGILVTYQIVKMVDKKGTKFFNVPIIIARRLWRLLPSAMMTLGIILVLPLMNKGPVWKDETSALAEPTKRNWWAVLLCVTNFLHFFDSPMVSLWYIAVDVQLLLMALVILAILFRHAALAKTVMVGLSIISVIVTGLVTYFSEVLPVFILRAPDKEVVFDLFFYNHSLPHNHITVYIIGMAVGMHFARNEKPTLPLWSVIIGWPLSLGLLFTGLFSAHTFTSGPLPSPVESFFFSAFSRTIWALGLAIMTILCATRNGGAIGRLLSWQVFIPLNRLTYLVYLLHVVLITYLFGSMRGIVDCYHHIGVWVSAGTIALTFVGAYVMKVFYEAPLCELEKLLLERMILTPKKAVNEVGQVPGAIQNCSMVKRTDTHL